MYGSSFISRTLSPRASRIAPRLAEVMPLPSEETTPPVMKMNRVMSKPGGPSGTPGGSHDLALEVRCWLHPDGTAKYQKRLALASSSRHHSLLLARAINDRRRSAQDAWAEYRSRDTPRNHPWGSAPHIPVRRRSRERHSAHASCAEH